VLVSDLKARPRTDGSVLRYGDIRIWDFVPPLLRVDVIVIDN
jgi:hypothetical protein